MVRPAVVAVRPVVAAAAVRPAAVAADPVHDSRQSSGIEYTLIFSDGAVDD
jgi:hypothetical protein